MPALDHTHRHPPHNEETDMSDNARTISQLILQKQIENIAKNNVFGLVSGNGKTTLNV